MFFLYPGIPVTPTEREARRPVARDTGLFQKMLDEVVELSQFVEDLGFDAVTFPEHHLHTEGSEMGSVPALTQHVLMNTKKLMAGPIGYVLPGWNPLRLALETAWIDQITRGRTFLGFARGYQARWLNPMAQLLHVSATRNTGNELADVDALNREVFQEVFEILLLDARNGLIRRERVSQGTLTGSLVHPREVFRSAVREAAAAIVLVHNHPSGDPSPSAEDLEVTERLCAVGELLGIRVLDHLIVGAGDYVSFAERGLIGPGRLGQVAEGSAPRRSRRC